MLIIYALGFSSGLPLPLTSGTLQAYLSVSGIRLELIGLFSAVGIPYTLKFLWAPFFDRFRFFVLTRRRGWILFNQIIIFWLILVFSFLDPKKNLGFFWIVSFCLAFFSSSQDIVVDAYRTDILKREELGPGASVFVFGYRVAMIISGAVALILADRWGWDKVYIFLSLFVALSLLATLLGDEDSSYVDEKKDFRRWLILPLFDLLKIRKAHLVLIFIMLYKLGDAYLGAMTVPFLIKGVGFSPTDVGTINKALGIICTIFGALFGGFLMVRMSLWSSLFYFGLLQMVSNLGFILLSIYGKNYPILIFCVAFENISGGMGTSAFLAYLMSLCSKNYSASQFAILSSLSAFGRIFISPTSGILASYLGWVPFFFLSSIFALPGLILLMSMKKIIGEERQIASPQEN